MSLITDILRFTKEGIYCPKGDFWIDPSRKKNMAIITHAHRDHAAPGHIQYICHHDTGKLIKLFFGEKTPVTLLDYHESITINGVKITLFPAGHVLGSSQVLLEYNGMRCVVAGDYKTDDDGVIPSFETVNCDVFVTESTFAKPHYIWDDQNTVMDDMNHWWQSNREQGITSIVLAYSLGKSQRILKHVDHKIGTIYISEQIDRINKVYTSSGVTMPSCAVIETWLPPSDLEGSLIVVPSISQYLNLQTLVKKDVRRVSGWILDGWIANEGFALSDHADWDGLNTAVKATGAERIYVQHGFTSYYTKYLKEQGYEAYDTRQCIKRGTELELF
jgi:putative mRNA 3-end processing factor